jgi:hypothetical protein
MKQIRTTRPKPARPVLTIDTRTPSGRVHTY